MIKVNRSFRTIFTRYSPATDTKGARMKAYTQGGSVTVPFRSGQDPDLAVEALCAKLGWQDDHLFQRGSAIDGRGFVYLEIEHELHNGYANKETWIASMFLDGNYTGVETYNEIVSITRRIRGDNAGEDTGTVRYKLADALKDYLEDYAQGNGVGGDFIGQALSRVDWDSLAENWLQATAEERGDVQS